MAEEKTQEERLTLLEKLLAPFMGTSKDTPVKTLKQFNEESYVVHDVLYIPANWTDGHEETYDEQGVKNLVKAFNEGQEAGTIQPSLFHKIKTDVFSIGKAWYTEEPTMVGDTLVPEYTPMVEITFKSKEGYEARVNGDLAGLSIGALALKETLKELTQNFTTPLRKLTDFSFLFKGGHLTYTDWSVNGAASMINDVFERVNKELNEDELSEEQIRVAKLLGITSFEPIDKQKEKSVDSEATAPSTSAVNAGAQDAGVDKETLNKGNETIMSEVNVNPEAELLRKELEEFKRSVKIDKALGKYPALSEEQKETLSAQLVMLEDTAEVFKAFDTIVADQEAKVEVAKQAAEAPAPKGALAEKVDKELGHTEDQEQEVEKSLGAAVNDKMQEYYAKIDAENK